MNNGTYWKQMKECHQAEPIVEIDADKLNDVIRLLISGLETEQNHALDLWEIMIEGANEYIEGCKETDAFFGRTKIENEEWTEKEEIEQDRAERNSDLLKSEAYANTQAIYGADL